VSVGSPVFVGGADVGGADVGGADVGGADVGGIDTGGVDTGGGPVTGPVGADEMLVADPEEDVPVVGVVFVVGTEDSRPLDVGRAEWCRPGVFDAPFRLVPMPPP
jgi:hypothetical protein